MVTCFVCFSRLSVDCNRSYNQQRYHQFIMIGRTIAKVDCFWNQNREYWLNFGVEIEISISKYHFSRVHFSMNNLIHPRWNRYRWPVGVVRCPYSFWTFRSTSKCELICMLSIRIIYLFFLSAISIIFLLGLNM